MIGATRPHAPSGTGLLGALARLWLATRYRNVLRPPHRDADVDEGTRRSARKGRRADLQRTRIRAQLPPPRQVHRLRSMGGRPVGAEKDERGAVAWVVEAPRATPGHSPRPTRTRRQRPPSVAPTTWSTSPSGRSFNGFPRRSTNSALTWTPPRRFSLAATAGSQSPTASSSVRECGNAQSAPRRRNWRQACRGIPRRMDMNPANRPGLATGESE